MRRPSVFVLLIAALLLVGVATAILAATDGSAAPALVGLGLSLLAGAIYVADRRSQTARKSLELRLVRGIEATRQDLVAARQDLTELATRQDLAEVAERLDRLDARLDATQRRLVASSDAARLEAAERDSRMRPAL